MINFEILNIHFEISIFLEKQYNHLQENTIYSKHNYSFGYAKSTIKIQFISAYKFKPNIYIVPKSKILTKTCSINIIIQISLFTKNKQNPLLFFLQSNIKYMSNIKCKNVGDIPNSIKLMC